jgi:hypothetical protein
MSHFFYFNFARLATYKELKLSGSPGVAYFIVAVSISLLVCGVVHVLIERGSSALCKVWTSGMQPTIRFARLTHVPRDALGAASSVEHAWTQLVARRRRAGSCESGRNQAIGTDGDVSTRHLSGLMVSPASSSSTGRKSTPPGCGDVLESTRAGDGSRAYIAAPGKRKKIKAFAYVIAQQQ